MTPMAMGAGSPWRIRNPSWKAAVTLQAIQAIGAARGLQTMSQTGAKPGIEKMVFILRWCSPLSSSLYSLYGWFHPCGHPCPCLCPCLLSLLSSLPASFSSVLAAPHLQPCCHCCSHELLAPSLTCHQHIVDQCPWHDCFHWPLLQCVHACLSECVCVCAFQCCACQDRPLCTNEHHVNLHHCHYHYPDQRQHHAYPGHKRWPYAYPWQVLATYPWQVLAATTTTLL